MELIQKDIKEATVQTLFEVALLDNKKVTMGTAIVLPGERLPAEGTTFHKEDEYSYIMTGEIFTHSGGDETYVAAGSATFIPRGEKHWCRNDGDVPVEIIWVFVE